MKILERHILSEFSKLLLIAVLSFIVLFMAVDLFENVDDLMKHNVPLASGAAFFLYKVPFIIGQVSPVATLLAALLSLGILAKHGEITAMKAGGVPLSRAVMPLLLSGLLISVAVFAMNETLTPAALRKTDSFKKRWLGEERGSFGREGLWMRTSEGIINIRETDLKKNDLHGLTLYVIEKPFIVKERVYSRLVKFKNGRWVAPEATVWDFSGGGGVDKRETKDYVLEGVAEPEDLVNVENIQRNMSFIELWRYVGGLEAEGYEAARYKIDLYGKLTFPLVNFIMVLVGVPFALKTGRHGGIAAGVGLSIMIAFSYWIIFAVSRSIGQTGMVPPVVAAAFPDVLFLAVGALMFGHVRQ